MNDKNSPDKKEEKSNRRGLEDWEMIQPQEETQIKIPYWAIILVSALILGGVLLSFPFLGVRDGFERPWLDWGLLVGVGYGVLSLALIYFFIGPSKKKGKKKNKIT